MSIDMHFDEKHRDGHVRDVDAGANLIDGDIEVLCVHVEALDVHPHRPKSPNKSLGGLPERSLHLVHPLPRAPARAPRTTSGDAIISSDDGVHSARVIPRMLRRDARSTNRRRHTGYSNGTFG